MRGYSMRNSVGFLLLLFSVVACGDLEQQFEERMEAFAEKLKGDPVPESHASYVGRWEGREMSLLIEADGRVRYRRARGTATTSLDAYIKSFEGDDFVVGFGPIVTTIRVSQRPQRQGGVWVMTVDGVELVRDAGRMPFRVPDLLDGDVL